MSDSTLYQQQLNSSSLSAANQDYIEALYESYLRDPRSVSSAWKSYFDALPSIPGKEQPYEPIRAHFIALSQATASPTSVVSTAPDKQGNVFRLIEDYRRYGHYLAKTDPLHLCPEKHIPSLELQAHDLSEADLQDVFLSDGLFAGPASLQAIVDRLQKTYCGAISAQYTYIDDEAARKWVQNEFESLAATPTFSPDEKKYLLEQLTAAEGLERYLGTRFVGQKRFSIEGGDVAVPMLNYLIALAAAQNMSEVSIAMAHRGRLNVLLNVIGKPATELFAQFEGKHDDTRSGDVKYHQGYDSQRVVGEHSIRVSMPFNPSHLEIVCPVLEGQVRAKQARGQPGSLQVDAVLPVLLHGDSAFSGQGVVMETFNLAQTAGYTTGGTIHIVQNNQVGFTTDPKDDRSSFYCTDIAKMIDAPVFHVNADVPELAMASLRLAFEYRQRFHSDVVIDLVCYRRHGHNEADEPMATQPQMYQVIRQWPTVRALYAKTLIEAGIISVADEEAMQNAYRQALDEGKALLAYAPTKGSDVWKNHLSTDTKEPVNTGFSLSELQRLGALLLNFPQSMTLQPQVAKVMQDRQKMVKGELPLDWGCAETLAYASLLHEGYALRLSGQDAQRGTFSHRHAVLHNMNAPDTYSPLAHLSPDQPRVEMINSTLSEEAIMAFEYGYADAAPDTLVLWEAQFGDFGNGAQVVVDQFISSAEQKWARFNGLVLLLPHGFEGQGPEHSSARLERYLQLCAQDNMQVCVPTTPSQMFHLLRRQMLRKLRRPLIVMTPKSLLRHKLAVSSLKDLSEGTFQRLIPEIDPLKKEKIKRLVFCSGKVYYDLLQARRDTKCDEIALLRVEQLYPFPTEEVQEQLAQYSAAKSVVWCQEEPGNQGSWFFVRDHFAALLKAGQSLHYEGRSASASPATGYANTHALEQKTLVAAALTLV